MVVIGLQIDTCCPFILLAFRKRILCISLMELFFCFFTDSIQVHINVESKIAFPFQEFLECIFCMKSAVS